MAFQRSYSKVWWGSDNQLPNYNNSSHSNSNGNGSFNAMSIAGSSLTSGGFYTHYSQAAQQQHSLDYNNFKCFAAGNLSRIQEVDDEQNMSKLSTSLSSAATAAWSKRDSPGSLRSQDSGFSDNDESQSTRSLGARSASTASPSTKSNVSSPASSNRSVATPPTVLRRCGKSEFYAPLVSISRRISFNGTPTKAKQADLADISTSNDKQQHNNADNEDYEVADDEQTATATAMHKRRRRVSRQSTKPLSTSKKRILMHDSQPDSDMDETDESNIAPLQYNNETVYLNASYDNDTTLVVNQQPASTSTPKQCHGFNNTFVTYENPLLNGHSPSLQNWLHDLRATYDHEVMSTLQTKSIVQEAFKNLTITTNTVAMLIRQLQQRALDLQTDFERVARILTGVQHATLQDALQCAELLVANVAHFLQVLERRSVFFHNSRLDRKKFEDNLHQIRIITKDTRYSLEHQHYINLESLLDDIQVLKRYLLIAIRLVFEKMVAVIVQSIEHGTCDLMLRANINMIATLSNIDYEGFACLTDAFVQNEAVRTLLTICLEHRLSSVRALSLRALATICCAPAAIAQLSNCGGIDVLRDILLAKQIGKQKSVDIERREAVSLLTQITASWHGEEHRVNGLKDCVESIVEGLTALIVRTECMQTLLLCAAALNNLSRMEVTSHYSIMSNEAILRLMEAVEQQEQCVSIFLYEQMLSMLHNMSLNKKCHSHLANGRIINFITSVYETQFYKTYNSRAESDAQRRSIKSILHTLTRLVHDSNLGAELLEQHKEHIPTLFKLLAIKNGAVAAADAVVGDHSHAPLDSRHSRDISSLARELLMAQKQDKLLLQQQQSANEAAIDATAPAAAATGEDRRKLNFGSPTSHLKLNLARQESYV